MFSGIVEELGEVKNISRKGNLTLLEIKADKVLEDTKIGDSIAVNGTCLTIVKKEKDILGFEVMPETLSVTNLGALKIKEKVNLERALKVGDRVSGHFVGGHVDCLGVIQNSEFRSSDFDSDVFGHSEETELRPGNDYFSIFGCL